MDLTGDLLKLPDVDIVSFFFYKKLIDFAKRMISMRSYRNANRRFRRRIAKNTLISQKNSDKKDRDFEIK